MEDDREKVLASVRRNLRGVDKFSAGRSTKSPLTSIPAGDFDGLFAKFRSELFALGGDAVAVSDWSAAAAFIIDHSTPGSSMFIHDEIEKNYPDISASLASSREIRYGREFRTGYDKRELSDIAAAVYGCAACIAETGTVALLTDMRLPAALAEKLFVIVEKKKLLSSLDDLFTAKFTGDHRSSLFMITGPSRTADIEKQLVKGVHGPKDVFVIFTK